VEQLKQRLSSAGRALSTLQELLKSETLTAVERDASIQRFEYTFEAMWKLGKAFLREVEGLEIGSPKGVIRSFFQVGLFTEEQAELALAMVDDRNLTSHTYNESLARLIYAEIDNYAELMSYWLSTMKAGIEKTSKTS
jgi:nucleotidyltransferase substrate binding protein (TIGR01987 family)